MSSKLRVGAICIFTATLGVVALACTQSEDNDWDIWNYAIRVDSMTVQDIATTADTLQVQFFGWAGNNTCEGFLRFDAERSQHNIGLMLWGRHKSRKHGDCGQMMIPLQSTYEIPNPPSGEFRINVHQPDSSVLTRTVQVE